MKQENTSIVLLDERGRAIMQVRDDYLRSWHRSRFALFGGKIENGESPLEAAARELTEELGLDEKGLNYIGEKDNGLFVRHAFSYNLNGKQLSVEEGAGYAILNPGAHRALELAPGEADVINVVQASRHQKSFFWYVRS